MPEPLRAPLARLTVLVDELLDTVPGTAVLVLDGDLRIRLAGGTEWRESGPDPGVLLGRCVTEVFPPEVAAAAIPEYRAVLAGEERAFALRGSERVRWIAARPVRDADGTVAGVLACSWDGKEAEDRYRLLADNATDVVTRHDARARFRYVSPSVEGLMGWTPAELLERSSLELIHPDDVGAVRRDLRAIGREPGVRTLTYRMRRRDGEYRWLETTARALAGGDGRDVTEVQCSTRDVTDRRRTELELASRLAQQSAVARLGRLALSCPDVAGLQHEACRLVAETLDVELVYALEHLGGATMRATAGVGWPDGFVGSELEVASFGGEQPGSFYADGAVVIDDLGRSPLRARPLRANGVVSGASVLIGRRDQPLGLLGAHSRAPRPFSTEDLDFLSSVAHVIAAALQRARTEERIRHDALHDTLTGLPNRALLVDRLQAALGRGSRVGLLFVDLDDFKVVNDSLGHDAGDELLSGVGPRLQAALRRVDTVARFGGDEFAVLLDGVDDEDQARAAAERVVAAFAEPFLVAGERRYTSASVGVVVANPHDGREPRDLLADADAAMYRAKDRGRSRYEVFDAALRRRITERLTLEADLRRALDDAGGRLWVAYQPLLSVPERRIAGVEALVRLDHPDRGSVSPGQFIPVAEESGLITRLGARVLRTACAQVAEWRRELAPDLRVTVNLSVRQVADPATVDVVRRALEDTGLPAHALGLEITEGLLLEETPSTTQTLEALRALGARLVLDDFGTGYSSLSYLQRYPLDALKVDQAFVAALGADGDGDAAIVEAIIGMARALGLRVVAEGVETDGQLARLVELGCELAQGYLLARPLPPGEVEALLAGARAPASSR